MCNLPPLFALRFFARISLARVSYDFVPSVLMTDRLPAPRVCQAFEGKVAAQGFFTTMCITSPNMDYVPEYPVERYVIQTYADGRWGVREYSRWPQMLVADMMHVACIPRAASAEWPEVLWRALLPTTAWEEDPLTGVPGIGYIKQDIRVALKQGADWAMTRFELECLPKRDSAQAYRDHGVVLCLVLRQCLERMEKLPSAPAISVAVAAHVQRLTLELAGLCTYLEVVHRRLTDPTDYSSDVLPVLGTFVREGTAAQTCTRIGLPCWFLQPLTHTVKIWRTVNVDPLPFDMSGSECHPAIYHEAGAVAGIANLTGNWLRTMALSVSKLVCGTHMPALESSDAPAVLSTEDGPPEAKRVKTTAVQAKHIGMRPGVAPEPSGAASKKNNRRQRKRQLEGTHPSAATAGPSNSGSQPQGGAGAAIVAAGRPFPPQPAKVFVPSPFYSVPEQWADALKAASPVAPSPAAALYFYPPPFLLDTVSAEARLPTGWSSPHAARNDDKVLRYLHNLLRIRRFCRARLFDPSMSSQPLTIGEWRAALWGDYNGKSTKASSNSPAELRRAKRRQDEWNAICRLFGRVALMASYREEQTASFRGHTLTAQDVAASHATRLWLLWESAEINFRCELMALDTLLVQRKDWQELHRWKRESEVSNVWGRPASVLSVLPLDAMRGETDRWISGTAGPWMSSRDSLRALLNLFARWPDVPNELANADAGSWDDEQFSQLARKAVDFYVQTFVRVYKRLPTAPVLQPSDA